MDETEMEEQIKTRYPVSKVDFFKRSGNFTGTIKLTFNSKDELKAALDQRVIAIRNQRYLIEEYKPSPRVVKCHRCQGFGHIASRCRSARPKCGKCCDETHETKDCSSNVRKCAHCNENHETGNIVTKNAE